MFNRLILKDLENWTKKADRKPLVLRGARQVGKTTAVQMFAAKFEQYIYLNLEYDAERDLFEKGYTIEELTEALFFLKGKERKGKRTLVFIDEIQNSSSAVSMLRYFYESAKDIFVIAAGSLLESLIDKHINFPVGRVEYMFMKPLTFYEYLTAVKDFSAIELLKKIPCPDYAHEKILKHFYRYTLIGGMPEAVNSYAVSHSIEKLKSIYEGLLRSYLDDVGKYARNQTLAHVIRYAVENSFFTAGKRIRFEGFGNSNYRSREMGEAFRTLEKAMLVYLIYPSTGVNLPIVPDYKKSPRLHMLDTGLVNYFNGWQKEIFKAENLNALYHGRVAEHIVGQELLAVYQAINERVQFWVREKKQSNAQIDYIIPFEQYVIPVEVKAGSAGRLRSLHEFIDRAPHNCAVRIYADKIRIDTIKTVKGKEFNLLNLPYYLTGQIKEYLKWFILEKNL